MLDRLIIEFDRGLRTIAANAHSLRQHPDHALPEAELSTPEKRKTAALMRINHCGEVCAQALYNGQALSSRNPETVAALRQAAQEETEHLAWCEQRITELGGRKSLLNPVWYAGSFALGAVAGAVGDKWNLGFLAETEQQVGQHLQSHLSQLAEQDKKTQAIIEQMQIDEAQHAASARQLGAADLPKPIKATMRLMSKAMTQTTYFV